MLTSRGSSSPFPALGSPDHSAPETSSQESRLPTAGQGTPLGPGLPQAVDCLRRGRRPSHPSCRGGSSQHPMGPAASSNSSQHVGF